MSTEATYTKSKRGPLEWFELIAGLLFGIYAGLNFIIPLIIAAIIFFTLLKLTDPQKEVWLGAISAQAGLALWIIADVMLVGHPNSALLGPTLLLFGCLWIFLKPGASPVIVLSIYQLIALTSNVYAFLDDGFKTGVDRALSVKIVFRVVALAFMASALIKTRKRLHVESTNLTMSQIL